MTKQRGHIDPNFLTKQNLKTKLLGNQGLTVFNCFI